MWLTRTNANQDCIHIILGRHNDTDMYSKMLKNQIIFQIDDINIDDLEHMHEIQGHWGSNVKSITTVTTPFYYSLFEAFISKVSCAVVLPSNVNALKWNFNPFVHGSIQRVEVTYNKTL